MVLEPSAQPSDRRHPALPGSDGQAFVGLPRLTSITGASGTSLRQRGTLLSVPPSTTLGDVTARVFAHDLPDDLCAELRGAERVAVDTETTGLDWRHDALKLLQLHAVAHGALLVRVAGRPAPNLRSLLEDALVTKVFHHAPFDLRFISATWGVRPKSVFCTKAASKLLDPQLPAGEHGLAPLLLRRLSVQLGKGPVRTSDWGAPVLSAAQMEYAAADVEFLLPLADSELAQLEAKGLIDDFRSICAYMPLDAHLAVSGVPNPLLY